MKDSILFRCFSLSLVVHFFVLLACLIPQVTPLKKTPVLTVALYSFATRTAIEPQNENGNQAEKTLPLQPLKKVQKKHPSRARKITESQPSITKLAPEAASTSARLKQHLPSKPEPAPRKATAQFPLEPQPVSGHGEAVKSKQHQEMVSLPVAIEKVEQPISISPAGISPVERDLLVNFGEENSAAELIDTSEQNSGVAAIPIATENTLPPYPRIARRRGWEGEVLLQVRVSVTGEVLSVRIERSSGHSILDQTALKTVRNWLFQAASRHDKAVETEITLPIRFELQEV